MAPWWSLRLTVMEGFKNHRAARDHSLAAFRPVFYGPLAYSWTVLAEPGVIFLEHLLAKCQIPVFSSGETGRTFFFCVHRVAQRLKLIIKTEITENTVFLRKKGTSIRHSR